MRCTRCLLTMGTVLSLLPRLAVWEVGTGASPREALVSLLPGLAVWGMGTGVSPREAMVSLLLGLAAWEIGTGASPCGAISLLPKLTCCVYM